MSNKFHSFQGNNQKRLVYVGKSSLAQIGSAVNKVVITDRLKARLKDKLDLTSN